MWTIKKFWALYNTVGWWEWEKCKYPTRLDTYWQGCWHNCSYCYARALLDFRWLRHPNNPKFIDLKEAYKIIATEIPKDQITRLWWMTDCFQPVEAIHWITYNVLKAFNKCRKWYLIVTKSEYTLSEWWYQHLPLEKKIHYLSKIKKPQITVCEDVKSHYEYWKKSVNYNPEDCCNLSIKK